MTERDVPHSKIISVITPIWKRFNRYGLILQHNVSVDVHHQIDVGMTSQTLCHLRRDAGLRQIGDEGLTQGVEVGVAALGIDET